MRHSIIPSGGAIPCRLFIVGERPGIEEYKSGLNFVGPAGNELWSRLWDICQIARSDCYVANLVRTFSREPPSPAEIRSFESDLRADLVRVQPTVIVTVGYHAARWFLPRFRDVTGDRFHGLAFSISYGRLRPRSATLVPIVHSSAALRQPGIYQNQLSMDLRTVRAVLEGIARLHDPVRPAVFRVGLATTISDAGQPDSVLGLDTEGRLDYPWTAECLTVSASDSRASLVETHGTTHNGLSYVQDAIDAASTVAIHHAKHDLKPTARLGLRIPRFDDTMLMAYHLGLPQGLKELCARLLDWEMSDYVDLIQPLDDRIVRSTLDAAYRTHRHLFTKESPHGTSHTRRRHRQSGQGEGRADQSRDDPRDVRAPAAQQRESRSASASDQEDQGDQENRTDRPRERAEVEGRGRRPSEADLDRGQSTSGFPRRALTSINGILTKDAKDTPRDRWEGSKFAGFVSLPPIPTWKDLPQTIREPYAMTDAIGHRAIHQILRRRLDTEGLTSAYTIDRDVLPLIVRREMVGMACNPAALQRLSRIFKSQHEDVVHRISDLVGYSVNPHSSDQVSQCLFGDLDVTPTRWLEKSGQYTTQDKYLKARRSEHAVIPLIIEARQLRKYTSTYTDKLPRLLTYHEESDVWRYHAETKYTRTATGREAETIILLIPKHDPRAKDEGRENRAKAVRNCFYATRGHVLLATDLSQIELRAMADLSRDPVLLDAFSRGEDIHARVAYELLGAPRARKDQDESLHRLPAKTVNFGIINGMTEYGMLDQLHEAGQLQWDIESVRELLDGWWDIHEGVKRYWDLQIRKAKTKGYLEDKFGARRYLEAIKTTDDRVYAEACRQCLCPIQMTADRISKLWNARIWKRLCRPMTAKGQYCEPWLREHDCTTLEVESRSLKAVRQEMLDLVPQTLCIPTLAEAKSGELWGEVA